MSEPKVGVPCPRLVADVLCFPNGNTACFVAGRQFPDGQESWFLLLVQKLHEAGIDVEKSTYKLPGGQMASVFPTEDGWNWRLL